MKDLIIPLGELKYVRRYYGKTARSTVRGRLKLRLRAARRRVKWALRGEREIELMSVGYIA